MAAQRIRVTWEFLIDDSETAARLKEYLADITREIDGRVATAPGTAVVRFAYVMPRVRLTKKVTP